MPRQLEEAGLKGYDIEITENAIRTVVHHYTQESGVRNLEREIGSVCRKIAREVVKQRRAGQAREASASPPRRIPKYLGVPKYRPNKAGEKDEIGLTNGLAYMTYGGAILECEVTVVPGKGKLVITGLLEKGMQESAQAAVSYIRSRQSCSASRRTSTRRSTSTFTSPSSCPRTARARASPWRPASPAR